MNEQFAELKREYSLSTTTPERKQELFQEMKDNILARIKPERTFYNEVLGKTYDVDKIEKVEDLYEIDGELNRLERSKRNEEIGKEQRKKHGLD